MGLPKKVLEKLIEINKEDISRQKMSMHDPIQQLFGTGHILMSIRKKESQLKELEGELKELKCIIKTK